MDSILTKDEARVYEKIMNNANDLLKEYRSSKSNIKKYFDLMHQKMIEMMINNPNEALDFEWFSENYHYPSDRVVAEYSDSLEFILRSIYPNSHFRIYGLELSETVMYNLEAKINNSDLVDNKEYEDAKTKVLEKMNENKTLEEEIRDTEKKLRELKQKQLNN